MRVSCVQSGSEPPPHQPSPSPSATRSQTKNRFVGTWWLASSMALCAAMGCGDGVIESDNSHPWAGPLRVLTWWRTDSSRQCIGDERGEVCAGQTLTNGYENSAGGAQAELAAVDNRAAVHDAIASETHGEYDGAIVNGGSSIIGLAACETQSVALLAELAAPDTPTAKFFLDRTPAELRPLVTCPDGRLFGVVLGLHSLNQLFSNNEILDQPNVKSALGHHGLDSKSFGTHELVDVMRALYEAGYAHPLVIEDDPGTWSRFIIENLMVALAGTDSYGNHRYEYFWSRLRSPKPGLSIDLSLLEAALALASDVAPFIQTSTDAIAGITPIEGHDPGVFTVTGDWKIPELAPHLGARRFPGTESAYVYTTDVAVAIRQVTARLDVQDSMLGWFKAITSTDIQSRFALQKNAVSPVTTSGGQTRGKTREELFVVDGEHLVGIPGLPSYVPYLTFDNLEIRIEDYMRCLTQYSADHLTRVEQLDTIAAEARHSCETSHQRLITYVRHQYCTVISGSADGCIDATPREDEQRK